MPDIANNQSVERAVGLLRALATSRGDQRASDLASSTGLGLSTATRLLATLGSLDLIERDDAGGTYRLGPLALTIGGAATNQSAVYAEARMIAQNLAAQLGLGVNLARRYGKRLQYLLNAEGPLAPKSFALTGQTNPLHATGLGKCLLLGLDPDERRALLPDSDLVAFTAKTITSHKKLDAELAAARAQGYAAEDEELALGRACVAAPIRDRTAAVVAAISISGPLSALDLDNRRQLLTRTVIEAADSISIALGFTAGDLNHHAAIDAREPVPGKGIRA
jgi:DNA-binding IclR family transcriptional regulator